jgi:hypothetical protein
MAMTPARIGGRLRGFRLGFSRRAPEGEEA